MHLRKDLLHRHSIFLQCGNFCEPGVAKALAGTSTLFITIINTFKNEKNEFLP
jgi:hypothetical protein